MNRRLILLILLFVAFESITQAQKIDVLVNNAKMKIEKVKDYEADGKMKTNVAFLKVPISAIKIFYKNPNKFKLKSEKGVSFVPKGSMSINLNNLFSGNNFTIIDAGAEFLDNTNVRVAKMLPNDDNSDLVLTTLYIDPISFLILKSKTTTKENGTYELKMKYNKYAIYGLPDEILFSFNTKDYKLPKGITFDFDDGSTNKTPIKKETPKKGNIDIILSNYKINKGLSEDIFK
jgi:outer membrane lipoprotein-sorting protein